ncbi:hypothetical protein QRE66_11090 [Bacillus cereus]|nr:hypothetical protein QRE66_11090 [Bacillus cereus]
MFEIKYKLFVDEYDSNAGIKGTEGYFSLIIDNEQYGNYLDEEVDDFLVSVYWSFVYLIEAASTLKNNSTVYISDIETPKTWLEIKKSSDNSMLYFSEIEAQKQEGMRAVEPKMNGDIYYTDDELKNKNVTTKAFLDELLGKSRKYLEDLKVLNDGENHKYIYELKKLLSSLV